MTTPVNFIKIGGVTYSKDEVKSHENVIIRNAWEQYNEHKVTLKDGTKLSYQTQPDDRQASVDILDDGSINFYGLSKAEIRDNNGKNDVYRLMGCQFTKVMAYDNSLFTNDNDNITSVAREMPNGTKEYGKENYVYYNKGDTINGKYKVRHWNEEQSSFSDPTRLD